MNRLLNIRIQYKLVESSLIYGPDNKFDMILTIKLTSYYD